MQRNLPSAVVALIAVVALAGACNAPRLVATPSPASTDSRPSQSPTVTALPSPSAAPTTLVSLTVAEAVAYTGDEVAIVATATQGRRDHVPLSEATLDFGDGTTTTIRAPCGGVDSSLDTLHVFGVPGHYAIAVASSRLCDGTVGAADGPFGILVEPAAPPEAAQWLVCTTFQLEISGVNKGSSLGNGGAIITFRNRSAGACRLEGYPGIVLIDASGAALPTQVTHAEEGAYLFPAIPARLVGLDPNGVASFQVAYAATAFGPDAATPPDFECRPAASVRVVIPGRTQFGTARFEIAPCNGWVGVSPVFPGRDWISFP